MLGLTFHIKIKFFAILKYDSILSPQNLLLVVKKSIEHIIIFYKQLEIRLFTILRSHTFRSRTTVFQNRDLNSERFNCRLFSISELTQLVLVS